MKKKNKGFSLIELMISLSIMSIMMMVAVPSYSIWLAKLKMKSTSENINLGIMQSRAEAIRRNSLIKFSLGSDSSWKIIDQNTNEVINQKTAQESSGSQSTTLIINGSMLTYNGFGLLSANTDGSSSISEIQIQSKLNNSIQPLKIIIGSGGSSILCDTGAGSTDLACRGQ